MLDVLIALVLLGVGVWLGKRTKLPAPMPQPEQRELDRLREDRAAFTQLMGYNAQRAYGLDEE